MRRFRCLAIRKNAGSMTSLVRPLRIHSGTAVDFQASVLRRSAVFPPKADQPLAGIFPIWVTFSAPPLAADAKRKRAAAIFALMWNFPFHRQCLDWNESFS